MPRAKIKSFVCTDKALEKGLNVIVDELNRLGKLSTDGLIGFSNGEAGPKFWLNVPLGSQFAIAKAGGSNITAADWTDPDEPIYGTGEVYIYDRTVVSSVAKGKIRAMAEPCENPYHGEVEADWYPVIVAMIGGVWTIVNQDCVTGP